MSKLRIRGVIFLRLITKINIYFGIILMILMFSVFMFTQYFFQKELEEEAQGSLRVTYQSFKLTLDNIISEQKFKASAQTRREIFAFSIKERIPSVLNFYFKQVAQDYNLDLIEAIDGRGVLLADNHRAYERLAQRISFKKPLPGGYESYLTQRDGQIYLVTTIPVTFADQVVGYLNLGTLIDQRLNNYFSSILHSKLLLFGNRRLLLGIPRIAQLPAAVFQKLATNSGKTVFQTGNRRTDPNYYFIFFTVPTDATFSGIFAIAKTRTEVLAALLRLKIFSLAVVGVGLLFGVLGANFLARNIKRSIFGMEPQEIAALLDQRTAILQSTFEGIIALDQRGRITLINKVAQQMLPSNLEMIGQPAENFFRDLNFREVLAVGQALYNQQQVIGETVVVYNMVPLKSKQTIRGAVITLRDLTEFQKVAEELVEVKNYTQALRAQSHEFMNKLQSLSGLIQLKKYDRALTLLHEASESHQDLISQLTEAFPSSAVSGILLGKFNRAKELNIRFELDQHSFIPRDVRIPDNEMVCIVGNLIENAFEALQESQQDQKMIWVKIQSKRGFLRIAVADNGPGIPASIGKQIFKRGFTTKKGQNKGIGLSLVKQCVENLRGSLRFHSGRNLVFLAKIPLKAGVER